MGNQIDSNEENVILESGEENASAAGADPDKGADAADRSEKAKEAVENARRVIEKHAAKAKKGLTKLGWHAKHKALNAINDAVDDELEKMDYEGPPGDDERSVPENSEPSMDAPDSARLPSEPGKGRRPRKKRRALLIVPAALLAVVVAVFCLNLGGKSTTHTITTSDFEKAIAISQLSSTSFVYNGIAEIYREKNPEKILCYVAYNATVKVGIDMEEVSFEFDAQAKTITATLPEIEVNIADIDESSLSYLPENPDVSLSTIISACKEDAINEANTSESLYETAAENIKSVIEALISPLMTSTEYTLVWADEV